MRPSKMEGVSPLASSLAMRRRSPAECVGESLRCLFRRPAIGPAVAAHRLAGPPLPRPPYQRKTGPGRGLGGLGAGPVLMGEWTIRPPRHAQAPQPQPHRGGIMPPLARAISLLLSVRMGFSRRNLDRHHGPCAPWKQCSARHFQHVFRLR